MYVHKCLHRIVAPIQTLKLLARQARLEQELEKLREVKAKGQLVKQAVNKLYRSLEVQSAVHICKHTLLNPQRGNALIY